jgi:hypothetical protein
MSHYLKKDQINKTKTLNIKIKSNPSKLLNTVKIDREAPLVRKMVFEQVPPLRFKLREFTLTPRDQGNLSRKVSQI